MPFYGRLTKSELIVMFNRKDRLLDITCTSLIIKAKICRHFFSVQTTSDFKCKVLRGLLAKFGNFGVLELFSIQIVLSQK